MNNHEGEDSSFSHPIRPSSSPSPPLKEPVVGYDGLIAGRLYAADSGGVYPYVPKSCHQGGACRVTCNLYDNGRCLYKDSLGGDKYRQIDNLISESSKVLHPAQEQSPEKETLVDDDALKREDVASLCTLPLPAPKFQWEVKDIEDTIDEM